MTLATYGNRDTSKGLVVEGTVIAEHRGGFYFVDATIGTTTRRVVARLSGKLVKFRIRIVPGDRVIIEVSEYDLSRGRITRRL